MSSASSGTSFPNDYRPLRCRGRQIAAGTYPVVVLLQWIHTAGASRIAVWVGCAVGLAVIAVLLAERAGAAAGAGKVLRVCADPNNLPYSNANGAGFENELASLVARDLGRRVQYTWWPQRRGFIRTTLRAGVCDVVMGVPASFDLTLNTDPYYTSTWAFVTRHDRALRLASLDDPRLRQLSIGVPLVGDDYASVPPVAGLAARHIVTNVHGYTVYGDYSRPSPLADLITAVAQADVDIGIAWGPTAGYFASTSAIPLDVTPLGPSADRGLRFDVAMGVRRDADRLRRQLNAVLARRKAEIASVLDRFHVVRISTSTLEADRTARRP